MPHFYILHSHTFDEFYIGHTSDLLEERIRKHNSNHAGFTGKSNDWVIVYTEVFLTKELAYAREVKKWKSRKRISDLIKNYDG